MPAIKHGRVLQECVPQDFQQICPKQYMPKDLIVRPSRLTYYSVGRPKAAPRGHPSENFIQGLQKFTNNPESAYLGSTKLSLHELQFYFVSIKFRKFLTLKN